MTNNGVNTKTVDRSISENVLGANGNMNSNQIFKYLRNLMSNDAPFTDDEKKYIKGVAHGMALMCEMDYDYAHDCILDIGNAEYGHSFGEWKSTVLDSVTYLSPCYHMPNKKFICNEAYECNKDYICENNPIEFQYYLNRDDAYERMDNKIIPLLQEETISRDDIVNRAMYTVDPYDLSKGIIYIIRLYNDSVWMYCEYDKQVCFYEETDIYHNEWDRVFTLHPAIHRVQGLELGEDKYHANPKYTYWISGNDTRKYMCFQLYAHFEDEK